jgi:hypothetical protein
MRISGVIAILLLLGAGPLAAQQQLYFYPSQGQSPAQQGDDLNACNAWAVQQTGFNPAYPPPPQPVQGQSSPPPGGYVIRGVAGGSVLGLAVGAIAGEPGKGAAIGALAGGMVGGARAMGQQQAQSQQQAAAQQQYEAQVRQQRDNFNRALAACMQGRGYSVS